MYLLFGLTYTPYRRCTWKNRNQTRRRLHLLPLVAYLREEETNIQSKKNFFLTFDRPLNISVSKQQLLGKFATHLCMSLPLEYQCVCPRHLVPASVVDRAWVQRACLPAWDDRVQPPSPTPLCLLLEARSRVCRGRPLTCHMTKKMSAAHSTRVSM